MQLTAFHYRVSTLYGRKKWDGQNINHWIDDALEVATKTARWLHRPNWGCGYTLSSSSLQIQNVLYLWKAAPLHNYVSRHQNCLTTLTDLFQVQRCSGNAKGLLLTQLKMVQLYILRAVVYDTILKCLPNFTWKVSYNCEADAPSRNHACGYSLCFHL